MRYATSDAISVLNGKRDLIDDQVLDLIDDQVLDLIDDQVLDLID